MNICTYILTERVKKKKKDRENYYPPTYNPTRTFTCLFGPRQECKNIRCSSLLREFQCCVIVLMLWESLQHVPVSHEVVEIPCFGESRGLSLSHRGIIFKKDCLAFKAMLYHMYFGCQGLWSRGSGLPGWPAEGSGFLLDAPVWPIRRHGQYKLIGFRQPKSNPRHSSSLQPQPPGPSSWRVEQKASVEVFAPLAKGQGSKSRSQHSHCCLGVSTRLHKITKLILLSESLTISAEPLSLSSANYRKRLQNSDKVSSSSFQWLAPEIRFCC